MGGSPHIQEASKINKNYKKGIEIITAIHLKEYVVLVTFSNGIRKEVDFCDAIKKYAKGYYEKFKDVNEFKKFTIERGNIVWGKNWDFIFSVSNIYNEKF